MSTQHKSADGLDALRAFCAKIKDMKPKQAKLETPSSGGGASASESKSSEEGKVVIRQDDIDHLTHFVQLWTDVIEVDYVQNMYKRSDYPTIEEFETDNDLYNIGFFYVKVNPKCSPGEMLGLMVKIPFEELRIPSTSQISYATLSDLFPDKVCFQLMVLGDYFKYWQLVNPYREMARSDENLRMIMSGLGNFAVVIKEKFLTDCYELVKSFEGVTQIGKSINVVS